MLKANSLNKGNLDWIGNARLAKNLFEETAHLIDENYIFPLDNLNYLKEHKFLSLANPIDYGGLGEDISSISKVVQLIGGGCLSTSMIYGMHCQQVFTLAHATKTFKVIDILKEIEQKQIYLSSITSEFNKEPSLLTANNFINETKDSKILIEKNAPTATGAEYADAFLITLKKSEQALQNELNLVYAKKEELSVVAKGQWRAMGVRGTQSKAVQIKGELLREAIVAESDSKDLINKFMVPFGHIMWVSSWLGATQAIYEKTIKEVKRNKHKNKSELVMYKIAEVRVILDAVEALLTNTIVNYSENLKKQNFSRKFNIQINSLKIFASEQLVKCVEIMTDILGVKGYMQSKDLPIERVYRDLKSSKIMFPNDILKQVIGKMSLFNSELLYEIR